jgi:hypothetical protein
MLTAMNNCRDHPVGGDMILRGIANVKPTICRKTASFLFRATGSRGRRCLFPAFSGAALCADLALSTRHCRDPLAGSWLRSLPFHGCTDTQPAIGASALSHVVRSKYSNVLKLWVMALPTPNGPGKTLRTNPGPCNVVLRPFRMFSLGQRVQPATRFKQIEFFDHTGRPASHG